MSPPMYEVRFALLISLLVGCAGYERIECLSTEAERCAIVAEGGVDSCICVPVDECDVRLPRHECDPDNPCGSGECDVSTCACIGGGGPPGATEAPQIPWIDGVTDTPVVAPPEIPWFDLETETPSLAIDPPNLSPCGAWAPAMLDTERFCEPWPATGRATCGAGEAHFPGGADCERVGAACPTGDFPTGLPSGALHVLAGSSGGDGTAATPFGTIAEAFAVLSGPTTIALGRGRYALPTGPLPDGVTLTGACSEMTILEPSPSPTGALVEVSGMATLRDLTLAPGTSPGVSVSGTGAVASFFGVVVEASGGRGIEVDAGATLGADGLVVRDAEAEGLVALGGATLDISRLVLAGSRSAGLRASGAGTSVSLAGAAIPGTRPSTDGSGGAGVIVDSGAALDGSRLAVEDNHEAGVLADAGSVTLRDSMVRRTQPRESDDEEGQGIVARAGATLVVERVWIAENHTAGLTFESSTATITDSVVHATEPRASDVFRGVGVETRASTATLERVAINHSSWAGIEAFGGSLTIRDTAIRHTLIVPLIEPDPERIFRAAISAGDATSVDARRVEIRNSNAILISGAGSTGSFEDIVDTSADDELAGGLGASDGAIVEASRIALRSAGANGGTIQARDVFVRSTSANQDGTLTLTRGHVAHEGIGLSAGLSTVALTDVRIVGPGAALDPDDAQEGIRCQACDLRAERLVVESTSGPGLGVSSGTVRLEDAVFRDGDRSGLRVEGSGVLEASRVLVERSRGYGIFVSFVNPERRPWYGSLRSPANSGRATLTDVLVRDIGSDRDQVGGVGVLTAASNATVAERMHIERARQVGVFALGLADFRDLAITETRDEECVEWTGCPAFADGLLFLGTGVALERFDISDNPGCGLNLASSEPLRMLDGLVTDNGIGVCVFDEDVDLAASQLRVRYMDNGRRLQAEGIPIPEPVQPPPLTTLNP